MRQTGMAQSYNPSLRMLNQDCKFKASCYITNYSIAWDTQQDLSQNKRIRDQSGLLEEVI